MKRISWNIVSLLILATSQLVMTAPNLRVRREDEGIAAIAIADDSHLSPITSEDLEVEDVNRDKRKITETFGAKNAILGFVFGKIDNFIDAKTRFINTLDKQNVAKNQQHNIVAPVPIGNFQSLIQAVIAPKIQSLTSTIGGLSGSLGGVFGGSSGGSSGGTPGGSSGGDDDCGDAAGHAGGGASAGIGGILSSFLRLSGPILSASTSSASGGAAVSATATVGGDNSADDDTPY